MNPQWLISTVFFTIHCSHGANISPAAQTRADRLSLQNFHTYLKQLNWNQTVDKIRESLGIGPEGVPRDVLRAAEMREAGHQFSFGQADMPHSAGRTADRERAILAAQYISTNNNDNPGSGRIFFDLTGIRESSVLNGTLHFRIGHPPPVFRNGNSFKYELAVYRFINYQQIDLDPQIKSYRSITIGSDPMPWEEVKITDLVNLWLLDAQKNFGLMLRAKPIKLKSDGGSGEGNIDLVVREANNQNGVDGNMHLELELANARARGKYSSFVPEAITPVNSTCQTGSDACCRHKYMIDFDASNMSYIMSPKQIELYYCAGRCDPGYLSRTVHTHLTGQELHMRAAQGIRAPPVALCCAPTRLHGHNIVYRTPAGNVKILHMPNLIVAECGCA